MNFIIDSTSSSLMPEETKIQEETPEIQFQWESFPLGKVEYLDRFTYQNPSITRDQAKELDLCSVYNMKESVHRAQFTNNFNHLVNKIQSRIKTLGDVPLTKHRATDNSQYYDANDPFLDDMEYELPSQFQTRNADLQDYFSTANFNDKKVQDRINGRPSDDGRIYDESEIGPVQKPKRKHKVNTKQNSKANDNNQIDNKKAFTQNQTQTQTQNQSQNQKLIPIIDQFKELTINSQPSSPNSNGMASDSNSSEDNELAETKPEQMNLKNTPYFAKLNSSGGKQSKYLGSSKKLLNK